MKKENGFTIIEILVVTGLISLLVVMGASISAKQYSRRAVDNVTRNISSSLQLMKLKAARMGVQYQAVVTYNSGAQTLTIVTQRGESNRGSLSYIQETSQTIKVPKGVTVTPASRTFNFSPNGTQGSSDLSVQIRPAAGAKIKKCGSVAVSPLGRIQIIEGTWHGTVCDPIADS